MMVRVSKGVSLKIVIIVYRLLQLIGRIQCVYIYYIFKLDIHHLYVPAISISPARYRHYWRS